MTIKLFLNLYEFKPRDKLILQRMASFQTSIASRSVDHSFTTWLSVVMKITSTIYYVYYVFVNRIH